MNYFEDIDFIYKKPAHFCQEISHLDKAKLSLSKPDFIKNYKKELENSISVFGLEFRKMIADDIAEIDTFIDARYTKLEGNELSPYDYFRFIKYGHGLIIQDIEKNIKGCVFEIAYDTSEKTSYPLRLIIDSSIKGHNLGKEMVLYLSLLAMERGSKVNRSVISFNNHESLYIQLNYQGWILTDYNSDIKGITPYFEACLPLTKHGILTNKINLNKTLNYLDTNPLKSTYKLVEVNDEPEIIKLFDEGYVVIAFLKEETIGKPNHYLALPASEIFYTISK